MLSEAKFLSLLQKIEIIPISKLNSLSYKCKDFKIKNKISVTAKTLGIWKKSVCPLSLAVRAILLGLFKAFDKMRPDLDARRLSC